MVKQSKSVRILDIIASRDGTRFTDVQRMLWGMSRCEPFTRQYRGYWCTNLLGGAHYHAGLLRFFCEKGADGLWRRNDIPHEGHPWSVMGGGRYMGNKRIHAMAHRKRHIARCKKAGVGYPKYQE